MTDTAGICICSSVLILVVCAESKDCVNGHGYSISQLESKIEVGVVLSWCALGGSL